MNDQWNLNDENEISGGPKPLRDAYEAQKKQNADLAAQVSAMQETLKSIALSSTFDSLGVPAQARSLYKGDADPVKAAEWVNEMRAAFGGAAPSGTPGSPVAPSAPSVDSQTANQLSNFTAAGAGQAPSTNMDEAYQGVNQAGSVQDLIANFNRFNQ